MKEIIIVGAFCEIVELCENLEYRITGIIDNVLTESFMGYQILGPDDSAPELINKHRDVPVLVSPDAPARRKALVDYYSKIGFTFCNIISPDSSVSRYSKFGKGVVIQSNACVSTHTELGDFVKINSNANVMHESIIGNYVTVAPNSVILGRVKIGDYCYIGANSTILPNLVIGDNCTIGAGSVVTKDIKSGITVIGNPAREYIKGQM